MAALGPPGPPVVPVPAEALQDPQDPAAQTVIRGQPDLPEVMAVPVTPEIPVPPGQLAVPAPAAALPGQQVLQEQQALPEGRWAQPAAI